MRPVCKSSSHPVRSSCQSATQTWKAAVTSDLRHPVRASNSVCETYALNTTVRTSLCPCVASQNSPWKIEEHLRNHSMGHSSDSWTRPMVKISTQYSITFNIPCAIQCSVEHTTKYHKTCRVILNMQHAYLFLSTCCQPGTTDSVGRWLTRNGTDGSTSA